MMSQSKDTGGDTLTEKESTINQYICTVCVSFGVMGCGMTTAWSSPALAYLQSEKSEIPITNWQGSWIASVLFLGVIFGCAVVPLIIDRIGRKYTYLLFSLFHVSGWILIIFAQCYVTICVARILHGIADSALFDFISVYIAEISEKKIRGILGMILKASVFSGIFYVGLLGALVSYRAMNLMCLVVPLSFLLTFPFMPESPYFCLMKRRDEEAEKILMKLRGLKKPESVTFYIKSMKDTMRKRNKSEKNPLMDFISMKVNREVLLVCFFVKATKILSGIGPLLQYAEYIYSTTGISLEAKYCVPITHASLVLISLISVGFIDQVNRRTLFLISGIICTLALGTLGLFFYMKNLQEYNVSLITWIPAACLILFNVGYCSGIGPISYIIPGEIFPIKVKGTAVVLGIIVENLFAFSVGLVFRSMNDIFGQHGTFWIFATCCIVGSFLVFWLLPETRGKSLEEIQTELHSQKK